MSSAVVETQALLDRNALAYLLGVVDAGPVVGLDNAGVGEADLGAGFDALVTGGWLVPEGDTHDLNNRLALMAAVIAAPERTLMVSRHGRDGEQVVTYYSGQGLVIEQYRTDHDHYLITSLSNVSEALRRVTAASAGIAPTLGSVPGVRLPAELFGRAMTAEPSDDRERMLFKLFRAGGVPDAVARHWSTVIEPGEALLSIEGAGFAGPLPVVRRDLYCFGAPGVFVAGSGGAEDEIVVCGYDPGALSSLVELLWRSLADHHHANVEG